MAPRLKNRSFTHFRDELFLNHCCCLSTPRRNFMNYDSYAVGLSEMPGRRRVQFRSVAVIAATAILMSACLGGSSGGSSSSVASVACDDGLKTSFKPDDNTTVLLVKQFKAGDVIALSNTVNKVSANDGKTPAFDTVAGVDMCVVKLLVGPGNPAPASTVDADPQYSAGIGIEVWMPSPSVWNNIIRTWG